MALLLSSPSPPTDDSPTSPANSVAAGSDAGWRTPTTMLSVAGNSSGGMDDPVLHMFRSRASAARVTTTVSGVPSPSTSASRTSSTSLVGHCTTGLEERRGGSPATVGEPSYEPERK